MRKFMVFLLFLLSLAASLAHAQLRGLPPNSERGTVGSVQGQEVRIGWTTYRLSPGVTIRDQNNRFITTNYLEAGLDIVFTRDLNGDIAQIVILTAEERQKLVRQ